MYRGRAAPTSLQLYTCLSTRRHGKSKDDVHVQHWDGHRVRIETTIDLSALSNERGKKVIQQLIFGESTCFLVLSRVNLFVKICPP